MSYKKQAGMTTIGWVFVLAIIGFFAFLAIKFTNIYMDDYAVERALASLIENNGSSLNKMNKRKVFDELSKSLRVSNVKNITAENLLIKKAKDGSKTIVLAYNSKENIASNIYIWIEFEHSVEVPKA
jgi:hypothetical protein